MLLGLIVRDIADLFFTTAVEAVSMSARERNYNVVLGSAHSRADEAIALRAVLETRHCDGIVLLGDVRDQPRLLDDLAASHVPVVALWQGTALDGVATINIDNRGGIASAIDHLADLGHRRFGFIGGYPHGDIRERRAGFIEHLTALGMPPRDDHVHAGLNNVASGAEAFRNLIGMADPPTAIVTATDQMAIGALHAAHALGVSVPHQVSIVGFDDIPLAEFTAPPLTSVHQPMERDGRARRQLGDRHADARRPRPHVPDDAVDTRNLRSCPELTRTGSGVDPSGDRQDLARHEREIAAHVTFNYAVLDADETELLGCVYVDPPRDDSPPGADVITSWWVVDRHAGSDLEAALDDFVPRWLADTWGFRSVIIDP